MSTKHQHTILQAHAASSSAEAPPFGGPDYRFSVSVGPLNEEFLTALLVFRHRTLLLRPEQVQSALARSRSLMEECVHAGWLRPCIDGNRLVVFSAAEVAQCAIRITKQGRPAQGEPYLLPVNFALPPLLG